MGRGFIFLVLIVSGYVLRAAGPVATNDSVTTQENTQVHISLASHFTDGNSGPYTITIPQLPNHGSAVVNAETVLYSPDPGFFGTDSFQYQVTDNLGQHATAEVYILVRGTNLPPIVNNDSYTFQDTATTVILNVLANDTDPGNDTLYVAAVDSIDSTNALGILSLNAQDQVVFAHLPNTCGTQVFQYIACNIAYCDSAIITINVNCPDSIFLPQGFSPNGDGINDYLVFPGLLYYSNVTLNVFNRYGTLVYQSTDYKNTWNGTEVDTNKPLPDGTYFYVLALPTGKTYNNFVVINR